jgi:tRNA (guanine-N7-)-methyltransferase
MHTMTRQPTKVEAPELRVAPERLEDGVEWAEIFDREGPVEVEIGIGKGRFMLAAAAARPDVLHFGVDWANKYLRIAESRAWKRGLRNVRFARVEGRVLVERAIPAGSVAAYYVFYPDPWPKKRHHKRRFLQPETADHLARTLAPGGVLHVATDHEEYWGRIESLLDGHPALERLPAFGGEQFPLPVDQPLTNFEAKYRVAGRRRLRASWRRRPAVGWSHYTGHAASGTPKAGAARARPVPG